jgi:methyl-accepting chemotaxis protein
MPTYPGMPGPRSLRAKLLLFLLPPVCLAVAGLMLLAVSRATSETRSGAYRELAQLSQRHANDFDADARDAQALGHAMASLGAASVGGDRTRVNAILHDTLLHNPHVLGTYVAFEPNAFDGADAAHRDAPGSDADGRFGAYWNTLAGKPALDPLPDLDDQDYYNIPKDTGRDTIMEPFLYDGVLMTSYITPIKRGGKFIGIGGVDRSLNAINKEVARVEVLDSGYGLLVSRTGIFVSAPDKALIGKKTLRDVAKAKHDRVLERVAAGVASGRPGRIEGTDPWTGKDVVFSWAPVGSSSWGFVSVAPKAEIFAGVSRLRTQLLLVSLLVLIAIGAVVVLLARRLTAPIAQVSAAAERVSEGDVDVVLDIRSDDEVGRMAAAFGRTVAYLRENATTAERVASGDLTVEVTPRSERDLLGTAFRTLVHDLRELLGKVSSTATGVAASSQQMVATSDQAGRAVGDIATAVGQMAAGAQQQVSKVAAVRDATDDAAAAARDSAEQAREAAQVADDAHAVARDGVASADEMSAAMQALAGSSGSASDAIQALAGKSEQIGSIIETITGIADQTNLLALNAAIEAARAGEQGRGFAVVADEVRNLAEGSQQAAATISGLLEEIQRETQAVVAMVEDGAQRTQAGAASVANAREAFLRIGVAVEDLAARATRIAESAQQISGGAERIAVGVADVAAVAEQSSESTEQVSATTQQTSASTQEITASAQELARSADELERLVGHFRVRTEE